MSSNSPISSAFAFQPRSAAISSPDTFAPRKRRADGDSASPLHPLIGAGTILGEGRLFSPTSKRPRMGDESPAGPSAPANSPAAPVISAVSAASAALPPPALPPPARPSAARALHPAPAAQPKSKFFSDSPVTPSEGSSSEQSSPVTPQLSSAQVTPVQVAAGIQLIGSEPTGEEMLPKNRQVVQETVEKLTAMVQLDPDRVKKAQELARRALKAGYTNLSGGAAPLGSLEFHRSAARGLGNAGRWVGEALPPLAKMAAQCHLPEGEEALPVRIYHVDHVEKASKVGNSVVGLHMMHSVDFEKDITCHAQVISASNGAVGLFFTEKSDTKGEPKFSSCFPTSMFRCTEELIHAADHSTVVGQFANRRLIQLNVKGQPVYAEVYVRNQELEYHSIFPFFAYFLFGTTKEYPIIHGLTLSPEQVLELAAKALLQVNPRDKSQDSPLRYPIQHRHGLDLVVDLAPQLLSSTKIPSGIMVQCPISVFASNATVAQRIREIIKCWKF